MTWGCRSRSAALSRIELQKPLFQFDVAGSRCRPDVLVTVTRPGGYGHRPRRPRRRPSDGPYEDRDTVRYVIEVMGFDDPEYEKDKGGHAFPNEMDRPCEPHGRRAIRILLQRRGTGSARGSPGKSGRISYGGWKTG